MSNSTSAMSRLRSRGQVAGVYAVVLDREWAAEMLRVAQELVVVTTKIGGGKPDTKLVAQLEEEQAKLQARQGDAIVEFKFRHCSPVRYEQLMSLHRPTEAQREEAKTSGSMAMPRWAPEFRPAFIAEVLLEPKLTTEEIGELFGEGSEQSLLSPGEAAELFTAALVASNNVARFEPS